MTDQLTIAVTGIGLRGRCGVTPEERALGQNIVVDVRLVPSGDAGAQSDDLDDTIDYGGVVDLVRGLVEEHEYNLIEHLATVIVDRLWDSAPLTEATVTVHKPAPPVSVPVTEACVEVVRRS